MKKYFYRLIGLCLALCVYAVASAQQPAPKLYRDTTIKKYKPRLITAIAEMQGDSAVLRWSPADAAIWLAGQTNGYVVKRFTVDTVSKKLTSEVVVTQQPVTPWPLDQFKQTFESTHDTLLAAAAEVMYNKVTALAAKGVNPPALMDKANQQNDMRLYGQLVACFSPLCARAMGLSYTDRTIQKGKEYLYQIYLAPNNVVKKGDTAFTVVNTARSNAAQQMPAVTAIPMDRVVQFKWNKDIYSSFFVAYLIERSDDGGKTFHQTHKLPILEAAGGKELKLPTNQSIIRDSLPQNYIAYQYRLRGINAFGDHSAPSNVVSVTGQYRQAPAPATITSTKNFKDNFVKIDWKQSKPSPAIGGYLVGRGNSNQGPFLPITREVIKPAVTTFTDSSASANEENYYIVTTFDTAGNFSNSYPAHVAMVDTIPPDAPKMVIGTIDTFGRILISWHRPMAPDVSGYMIQRANALNHDFVPVSRGFITDTAFKDSISLRTLTKHIYYRVIAYDKVRNSSIASNIVDISKPDIVPPVPAVFTNYITTDTSIQLFWNKSTSVDLNKQYLYRKAAAGDWMQVAVLDNTQGMYNDTAMQKQIFYSYQIVSVDSAGLKSEPSFPISAKTYFKAVENGGGNITATVQQDSAAIKVEWALARNNKPVNILLYRSVNDGGMMMYENIPATQTTYLDKRISAGNTYKYSFKCIYAGNNESTISKEASVVFSK